MNDPTMGRHAAQAAGWNRFKAGVARLIAWIRAGHRARRDLALLRTLDDRQLADIGLARSEIDHAVRHGRWRDSVDSNVLP